MMYKLSVVLLSVVSFFSVVMLLLLFYPVTITKPNVQPYKVITKNITTGGQLVYVVDACKYVDVESHVTRSFVNVATMTEYPAIQGQNNVGTGCHKTPVTAQVPLYIPAGVYYLQLDVVYKVNALQDKTYHFTTEDFTVATNSALPN